MKGTEHFTRTIAEYLNQRAMADPLFAPNLMKPNKNIEECITYILNEVQKSGCNGFDDDDELLRAWLEKIFSMAVHYYDEDDIEVGKAVSCKLPSITLWNSQRKKKPKQGRKPLSNISVRNLPRYRAVTHE